MWPWLIAKAKEGGLDVIQTYVFWNVHEPIEGQYNFEGRNDLVAFVKQIRAQGLYCSLRIGPFIEAEWKYGGFPFWLHDIPGIVFRSDNEPFKYHMQRFTSKIVNMMKAEGLYSSQGGPIILSQIENEYQNVEAAFHEKGPPYVRWLAAMAEGLQTGVPWMMCKQQDAPDPIINTCNGMQCGETFAGPNSPMKPSIWTENWTSFYQVYGDEPYIRSAEDIAYAVALFLVAKKGSFVNYYMYHGGTNFGRFASAYIITAYYDQAPLDEYGLIRQPKWGHLRELHEAIKQCSSTMLYGTYANVTLGQLQEAHVFEEVSGHCVSFITNRDQRQSVTVNFRNDTYTLPARSISILRDCKTLIFNTAKFMHGEIFLSNVSNGAISGVINKVSTQYGERNSKTAQNFSIVYRWEAFADVFFSIERASLTANSLLEQVSTTKDETDYLWYSTSFEHIPINDQHILHVESCAHVVHAFVNGIYLGSSHGSYHDPKIVIDKDLLLKEGKNAISLLSVMVGLPDSGPHLESRVFGLRKVTINNGRSVEKDISNQLWGYQTGLLGEKIQIYTVDGMSKVAWGSIGQSIRQPLMWYKTTFMAPSLNESLVLNLASMGKGEVWINGESIGRYWVSFTTSKGRPSQFLYHIPASFLKASENLLVIFEEMGGDPLGISLETVSIRKICCFASESHPPSLFSQKRKPHVSLQCPHGKRISSIDFASFGDPYGDCDTYAIGSCHAAISTHIVEKSCLGRRSCTVVVSSRLFGDDPCPGTQKSLQIAATCG